MLTEYRNCSIDSWLFQSIMFEKMIEKVWSSVGQLPVDSSGQIEFENAHLQYIVPVRFRHVSVMFLFQTLL